MYGRNQDFCLRPIIVKAFDRISKDFMIQALKTWYGRGDSKFFGVSFACGKCASQVEENWTERVENVKKNN